MAEETLQLVLALAQPVGVIIAGAGTLWILRKRD